MSAAIPATSSLETALIVAGPTASGKSALGLELARRLGGTVINADAMQTYDAFPVLTAQPTAAERGEIPHALYGCLPLATVLSAQRWRALALEAMQAAVGAGRVPILVGGSGLYVKALVEGFAAVPDVAATFRAEAEADWAALGPDGFRARLGETDPDIVARLKPFDRQRHVRAWEVWRATGRTLSAWQAEPRSGPPPSWAFRTVQLAPERAWLRARIAARFEAMIAADVVEEVRPVWQAVRAGGLAADLPGLKAHGAPELFRFLDGAISLDDVARIAIDHTRQYAKRQMTWSRGQIVPDVVVDPQESDCVDQVLKLTSKIDA